MRKVVIAVILPSVIALVGFALPGSGAAGAGNGDAGAVTAGTTGPCEDPVRAGRPRCPDLIIGRPSEMYADRKTIPGRVLLRATNDIMSRGEGPIELRGRRDRTRSMNVTQAIRRKNGSWARFPIQARLRFVKVGAAYGGAFWKVRNPLRFELWRVDRTRRKIRMVRTGPKQFYCFRDLERTRPGPNSPTDPVYPACNQNPRERKVTLGTSVGWSDIYPSTYDRQWIDVTGLRGCFAYVLRLDPAGLFHELDRENNVAQRVVRLPWKPDRGKRCPRP
ncbi:MAG: hypothetical protein JJE10_01860 [Thermoleophilia bacterium]|nr:hypothetical protein [Thermoleophilia bacterium]